MDVVCAKLKLKTSKREKYRQVLTTDDFVFDDVNNIVLNTIEYSPDTLIEESDWFYIPSFSQKEYCIAPICDGMGGMDFDYLSENEFQLIDYIFVIRDHDYLFQNITKSKLVTKKGIIHLGNEYRYIEDNKSFHINSVPDAIYRKNNDTLYFKRLESITSIFKGISDLYRDATNEETQSFLDSGFIQLQNGFNADNVKTRNRKRIAIAMNTLSSLTDEDKNQIFNYISEYCPGLFGDDNRFSIGNEDELTKLLYGIEQRFYTTAIGNEKRLANSIITL